MLTDLEFLLIHKTMGIFRTDPTIPNGVITSLFLPDGRSVSLIKVRRPNQDLFIADLVGTPIKVLSQNLLKPSDNTRWILEDPEHRGISWLTHGRDTYLGECRSFLNDRGQLTHSVTMF